MTDETARLLADVIARRCERAGVPGVWRAFWEDGKMVLEVFDDVVR